MSKVYELIEKAMRHHKIMFFFIVALMILGVYGLIEMPKQEFPEFTIRQGLVVGVYPGATSAQVEEQLTKPLERFLFTYDEVRREKTYSMSRDGIVYVMVELEENVKDKDKVWSKIKHGLSGFKSQLPSGVLAVIANDDFGDTSALLIALESDTRTYRELEDYAEILEDRLRRLKSASNLRKYGLQKEQISVYLDRDKLAAYGLNYKLLATTLFSQGVTTYSGMIETTQGNMPLYVSPLYDTEKEVAEQIIYSDPQGNILRLKDVATIKREYESPTSYTLNNGKKSIILSMEMREGFNIVKYGKDVDEILSEFSTVIPDDVSIERIADQPKVVKNSINSFLRDLIIAIIVVILVMMILFPFRTAVIVSTTIPITIFITLGIMYIFSIPLNMVTLAVLIIVLGMIVDNSVVVIDGYFEYLEKGFSRWRSAVLSAQNYSGAILLATFSICIVFFPLLTILTGIWKDFIIHFPWTFSIALFVSFILAMIYIPFMEYLFIKRKVISNNKKFNLNRIVQNVYNRALDWTFRYPYITICTTAVIVIFSLVVFFNLDTRMFPYADRDQFAVEIYLPYGTPVEETRSVADSVYKVLAQDERVTSIASFIGMSSPRFQSTYAPNIGGENFAQFIVNTKSNQATVDVLDDYASKYQNHYPNAFVKFKQLEYTLAENTMEVRLSGDDISELKQYADTIIQSFSDIKELVWLHTNYEEPLPGMKINLNTTEASRLGVVRGLTELELAGYYSGIPVETVWEEDYPLSIVMKTAKEKDFDNPEQVEDKYISTAIPGISVPLRQVATVKPVWNEGQIVRRNGVRTISILADVKRGANESDAFSAMSNIMENKISPILPHDIKFEYGGVYEADREVIPLITKAIIVAICLFFLLLLFNFMKISVALTALLSLSLIIPGMAFGLWITDTPLSLTGLLGLITLFGITIRNAIILFEHAENSRTKERQNAKTAAYEAGKRRIVPIFLTSMTTAIGIIPMIISNSSLWSPTGITIFWGTIFGMVLLVLTLPVVYWKLFVRVKILDIRDKDNNQVKSRTRK
ncbi:MAG: AcrB/AcrD/AcrF family protein [Anaerophaga sp.]|nr:AcrB/AcrD/AcrF family protein [Anaerophaga sp.]